MIILQNEFLLDMIDRKGWGIHPVKTKNSCLFCDQNLLISSARNYKLPIFFMAAIFILSSIPGIENGGIFVFVVHLNLILHNLLHIPLYGILQILWLRSLTRIGKKGFALISISFGITISYGIFDEFHQMFIPGRYGSLSDILLNVIGACIGTTLFLSFQRLMTEPLQH